MRALVAFDRKQVAQHHGFALLAHFMRQCALVVGLVVDFTVKFDMMDVLQNNLFIALQLGSHK